jgi:hypothetical protein
MVKDEKHASELRVKHCFKFLTTKNVQQLAAKLKEYPQILFVSYLFFLPKIWILEIFVQITVQMYLILT